MGDAPQLLPGAATPPERPLHAMAASSESDHPAVVVQRFVDAANRRDAGAMCSLVAEEAVFARFPGGEPIASGRVAIRAFYDGLLPGLSPTLRIRVQSRIVDGSLVIDREHFSEPLPQGLTTSTWIYEVRGGLIYRAWLVRDAGAAPATP